MTQRCILSNALRGLKLFPTTQYGITLSGYDCNESNRKKKQVSDIKKLCAAVPPISLNSFYANPRQQFEQFNCSDRHIFAILDNANTLRHDVLTFPVPYGSDADSKCCRQKPCTTDQCVQTDSAAFDEPSDVTNLLNRLKASLQNGYAIELMKQGNEKKAICKWTIAAEFGSLDALYNLGVYFCSSLSDIEKGAAFWKAAARGGHIRAMYQLGALHIRHLIEFADPAYGLKLIEKSAEGGYSDAQFYMGIRMLKNADYLEAEEFLKDVVQKSSYRKIMKKWLTEFGISDELRCFIVRLLQKKENFDTFSSKSDKCAL